MKARRDVTREQLRTVRLFDGCSDEELERIAQLADEIAVPAGYVLVYEGDWGHEVFVVAEGEAEVTAGGDAGPARRGRGDRGAGGAQPGAANSDGRGRFAAALLCVRRHVVRGAA